MVGMDMQLLAERGVCGGGCWASGEISGLATSATRDT